MNRVLGSWIPGKPPPQRWRPSLVPASCVQMKSVWWWCCRRLGNKDLSKIMEIEIEKRTSANLENKLTLVVGKRHQFLPPCTLQPRALTTGTRAKPYVLICVVMNYESSSSGFLFQLYLYRSQREFNCRKLVLSPSSTPKSSSSCSHGFVKASRTFLWSITLP